MADIGSILLNLSESIVPVVRVATAVSYILAIFLAWTGLKKLQVIANARARSSSGGRMFEPIAYLGGAVILLYLPTAGEVAKNTFFGTGSPIAYESVMNQFIARYGKSAYVPIKLAQMAGIFFFVRGTFLLVQATNQGSQHGPKGMAFLIGGIFLMNIQFSIDQLDSLMQYIALKTL